MTRLLLSESVESLKDAAMMTVSVLEEGGVVLYPSDTVYGLLCRADSRTAVERIRSLKGYTASRPFILIVDGVTMAGSVADGLTGEILGLLGEKWPGRFTAVLRASGACPQWVRSVDGTVALRHPADTLSSLILAGIGTPLVSTSANAAGAPSPLTPEGIPEGIRKKVDLFIDRGVLPPSEPSTIVRLTGKTPEILRGGRA